MNAQVIECDAVLLDMDGTLVDSKAIVERMWLVWADRHGIPAETILAVAHGRRTLETMRLVAPHLATPEEAARLDAMEALQKGGEVAVPGAKALLDALPAGRWAVVTSAVRQVASTRIAAVGLPSPAVLVGAEDVQEGKPSPEGYLHAAVCLGVPPHRCVVVEDTPAGIEAGRAAGARVIGILTTYAELDGCDLLIPDLRALKPAVPGDRRAIRLVVEA